MQVFPEAGCEKLIAVRNNLEGQSIVAVPFVEEDLGCVFRGDRHLDGLHSYVCTNSVGHGHYTVVTVVFWQRSDEVYGYAVSSLVWYGQRVEGAGWGACRAFVSLAVGTCGDVCGF